MVIDGVVREAPEQPPVNDPIPPTLTGESDTASTVTTAPVSAEKDSNAPHLEATAPHFPATGIPQEYLVHLSAAGRSSGTIKEYTWDLLWWQRQAGTLPEITLQHIEAMVKDMHPCTAQRKIASLRSYAKWLLRENEDRLHSQVAQVMLPKTPGRIPRDRGAEAFKDLSRKAMELTAQGDRRGIWIGLMLCCGLRISEIQTTQVTPGDTIKVRGKGNKERLIPAPEWLRSALRKKYKNGGQWRKARHLIWKELKKMDITHPHSLRHTYASELVRQGFSLEQVQRLLGHAQLETSLIYAKVQVPKNVTQRLGVE